MTLGAFGDASDGCLHFSGNGVGCFPAAVPGTVEMGFEFADAFGYGRHWQGDRFGGAIQNGGQQNPEPIVLRSAKNVDFSTSDG